MTSRGSECSRDPAGPTEYRPVKQTFITHPDLLLHITYSGLDGREETLVTTAAHPFFTLEAQAFVDAQELELGDVFRLASGDTAVVLDITHQRAPDGETFTSYNFEVEDSHTYFVGEQGVWVHNANSYLLCARLAAEYEKSLAKGMDAAKARSQAAEKLKRLRDQGTIKPDAYDKHLADLNKKLDDIDGKSASKGSASNGQKDGVKLGEKATGGANASKEPLWTSAKGKTGIENAFGHWTKHRKEFPEFQNAMQYARAAREFATNPPAGVLSKVRANGDRLFYDPATNTFLSQRADGAIRTMFRPTNGIDYWNLQ